MSGRGWGRRDARHGRLVLALLLVSLGLAACGGNGDDQQVGPPVPSEALKEPVRVTVVADDFSFDVSRTSVPQGLTQLEFVNRGDVAHQLQVLRPQEGKSLADVTAAVRDGAPVDGLADAVGGAGALGGVPPGDTQAATVSLVPGKYLLVCLIDGHAAEGMISKLRVGQGVGASGIGVLGSVTLDEFSIQAPRPFDGSTTFEYVNVGKQAHEVSVFRFAGSVGAAKRLLLDGDTRPATDGLVAAGGGSALSPGRSQYVMLGLEPGPYVFACLLRNGSERPHYERGMITRVVVQ